MTLGQRIAELRKEKRLSQEALGDLLGVSRQAISKWESDITLPEIEKLVAMSKLFGVTVGELLGVEPGGAAELAAAPETASAEQKKKLYWRRIVPGVVIGGLTVVLAASLVGLYSQHVQIARLTDQVNRQMEQLNEKQIVTNTESTPGLVLSNTASITRYDWENDRVTLEVAVMSGKMVNDTDALYASATLYATDADGNQLSADTLDCGDYRCAATFTLPVADGYTYYFAVDGEAEKVPVEEELRQLLSAAGYETSCNFMGEGTADRLNGFVELSLWPTMTDSAYAPELVEVNASIVVTGADGAEKSRTPVKCTVERRAPEENVGEGEAVEAGAEFAASIPLKGAASDFGMSEGDRLSVEMFYRLADGRTGTEICTNRWTFTGSTLNWD